MHRRGFFYHYGICAFFLILIILLEQYTNIDLWVQSFFYNSNTETWLITKSEHKGILGFFLYRGYKKLLIVSGILSLLVLLYVSFVKKNKECALFLSKYLLALIIIPASIGFLKPITNVHCPGQLEFFDGRLPYVRLLESNSKKIDSQGRCFPAGHATSGFFLIILYYALKRTTYAQYRYYGLLFGCTMGWITGIYQMARGEHFISHTLVTMVIAWTLAWTINSLMDNLSNKK